MNQKEMDEIISFINKKYNDEVPRPVKFLVKRKVKKIEKVELGEFPEIFRKCTIEELIIILKNAHTKKKLDF